MSRLGDMHAKMRERTVLGSWMPMVTVDVVVADVQCRFGPMAVNCIINPHHVTLVCNDETKQKQNNIIMPIYFRWDGLQRIDPKQPSINRNQGNRPKRRKMDRTRPWNRASRVAAVGHKPCSEPPNHQIETKRTTSRRICGNQCSVGCNAAGHYDPPPYTSIPCCTFHRNTWHQEAACRWLHRIQ